MDENEKKCKSFFRRLMFQVKNMSCFHKTLNFLRCVRPHKHTKIIREGRNVTDGSSYATKLSLKIERIFCLGS